MLDVQPDLARSRRAVPVAASYPWSDNPFPKSGSTVTIGGAQDIPVFCEFAWALKRGYGCVAGEIAAAIEAIARIDTAVTDSLAVESGLAALRAGGDFGDGSIASQGERPGGPLFSSFALDKGVYAGLGYNGRGVASATMMGQQLANVVLGEAETLVEVRGPRQFVFHRFRQAGISWHLLSGSLLDRFDRRSAA